MAIKTYLVSYDLNRPRAADAYPDLINQLKADGATNILYSEWLVRSDQGSLFLAKRYLAHMDNNDSIFVCEVADPAWFNLRNAAKATPLLNAA